jgi:hypothetical protein
LESFPAAGFSGFSRPCQSSPFGRAAETVRDIASRLAKLTGIIARAWMAEKPMTPNGREKENNLPIPAPRSDG